MQGVARSKEEIEDYKRKIIEYLIATPGGTIGGACAKLGVGYSTAFVWRKEDEGFRKQLEEARKIADEHGGDFAEGKLMQCIANGEFPAIKYYLSTRHKERGFWERQETDTRLTGALTLEGLVAEAIAKRNAGKQ